MQVGVDVHERLVHAVAMDGGRVVGHTTVSAGPRSSRLVAKALRQLSGLPGVGADVRSVTICRSVNESQLVQPARLAPVTTLRIAPNAGDDLPPMSGWPEVLRTAVGSNHLHCRGGHRFDGSEAAALDLAELGELLGRLVDDPPGQLAVTAAWAPVSESHEQQAAGLVAELLPGVRVACSHELGGGLGLVQRENATILNAALLPSAAEVTQEITEQVAAVFPGASVHFALSNGTVVEAAQVAGQPIQTLWSGWACMLTGAAVLSGHPDAVVMEVDDDSLRVGFTDRGQPRLTHHDVRVAGVRVNLWHPHVTERAPDLAMVPEVLLDAHRSRRRPVVVVGPAARQLPAPFGGLTPQSPELARAVGAASSPVGAEVVRLVGGTGALREQARAAAREAALQQAILAGALPSSVQIRSSEEVPLAYLPGDMAQLRVRAVGSAGG